MGFFDGSAGGIIGGAIGAVGSLLGGSQSSKDYAKYQQQQYEHQKEFAQNSIQWRVQDAKKAGIHPLYAMGQTPGYQPSDSSGTQAYGEGISRASNYLANAMGQLDLQLKKEQIEGVKLENDKKRLNLSASVSLGQKSQAIPALDNAYEALNGSVVNTSNHSHLTPNQNEDLFSPGYMQEWIARRNDLDSHKLLAALKGYRYVKSSPFGWVTSNEPALKGNTYFDMHTGEMHNPLVESIYNLIGKNYDKYAY